ncbi:hypothetical protein F5B19DRAFT_488733 [Rostrohypoxylon terebratum]|nr:hypothetical protein F5B19DRAFT_488733 [Rostrohypoxylon terebratum]
MADQQPPNAPAPRRHSAAKLIRQFQRINVKRLLDEAIEFINNHSNDHRPLIPARANREEVFNAQLRCLDRYVCDIERQRINGVLPARYTIIPGFKDGMAMLAMNRTLIINRMLAVRILPALQQLRFNAAPIPNPNSKKGKAENKEVRKGLGAHLVETFWGRAPVKPFGEATSLIEYEKWLLPIDDNLRTIPPLLSKKENGELFTPQEVIDMF